jgi:hypothetical protein
MDSLLYMISGWWILEWFIPPMPVRTTDRMVMMVLCWMASGGILLFWLIPHWHDQDQEAKRR